MEEKIIAIINNIISEREEKEMVEIETWDSKIRFRENLGFTSFELALLTVHIEEEFGVDIFEDGIVSTLGEITQILKANK